MKTAADYSRPCRVCGRAGLSVEICPDCYRACPKCGGPPVAVGVEPKAGALRCAWIPEHPIFAPKGGSA